MVYDEVFLYSHHESDPAGQKNCNAFDLVRLHKFGDWTTQELADDVPVSQRESFKQMAALALESKEVQHEMALNEFEVVNDKKGDQKNKKSNFTFEALRQQIEALNPATQETLDRMIINIAAARLNPVDSDVLAGVLRLHWPPPAPAKVTIVALIKSQGRRLTSKTAGADGTIQDIERRMIRTMLEQYFTEME